MENNKLIWKYVTIPIANVKEKGKWKIIEVKLKDLQKSLGEMGIKIINTATKLPKKNGK